MVKIFLTGATGYVGGEVLYRLVTRDGSKNEIACLVRDEAKAATVLKAFPDVRIVKGELDDAGIIEEEAKKADIVLHLASTGHAVSASAIERGMKSSGRTNPGYWIQMSGASLFCSSDVKANRFGEEPTTTYDDVKDLKAILTVISENPQRVVDNLIISQDPSTVKTALLVGPLFYGEGKGPVNKRSVQGPEIARVTLKDGKGFQLGSGQNIWSNLHVHDLGSLIVALVDAAIKQTPDVWNENGIYFPENGKMTFGELCTLIAKEANAQGYIPSASIDRVISPKEADAMTGHGAVLWGTNAVLSASRAKESLGWQPSMPALVEEISTTVRVEALRLGLAKD